MADLGNVVADETGTADFQLQDVLQTLYDGSVAHDGQKFKEPYMNILSMCELMCEKHYLGRA